MKKERLGTETKLNEMTRIITKRQKHPILFVGSGISIRYLGIPTWKDLLKKIAEKADCDYDELEKKYGNNLPIIAQELEYLVVRKAEEKIVESKERKEILRDVIVSIMSKFQLTNQHNNEIEEFKKMRPEIIITTNYDMLMETLYESKYEIQIGQEIIDKTNDSRNKVGKLYKIHGCMSKSKSIVITKEDYDAFEKKMNYLQAKLFTLFWENPLVFMGYSINDENIKRILASIVYDKTPDELKDFSKGIWVLDKADEDDYVEERELELLNGIKISVIYFELKNFDRLYKAINSAMLQPEFEELHFNVSKDDLINLLIEPLYSRQDKLQVAVRELLQNALDACKIHEVNPCIRISFIKENDGFYLCVSDNGVGMSILDIKDYFLTVGKSGKRNLKKGLLGQFGIGILTIFCIGDIADVYTKKKGNPFLAFKIEMKGGKENASWLTDVKESYCEDGYTLIKIQLSKEIYESIQKTDLDGFIELIGLSKYVFMNNYSIEVNYFNETKKLPSLNLECGFHKVDDELKISKKISKSLGWLNSNEEVNIDAIDENLIHDEKNKVLFNDMIYEARYNKDNKFKQLINYSLPFLVIDVQEQGEKSNEIKTGLSREDVEISGNFMEKIALNIYKLAIKRALSEFDNFINKNDKDFSVFEFKRVLTQSHPIINQNCNIVFQNKRIIFLKNYCSCISLWGDVGIATEFYNLTYADTENKILHENSSMHKSSIADLIESNNLVCISYQYLNDYMLKATNQHNGFRTKSIICLLKKLDFTDAIEETPEKAWGFVNGNKKHIENKIKLCLCKSGLLWFNNEKPNEGGSMSDCNNKYLIAFRDYVTKKTLDDNFASVLKEQLEVKSELCKFIGIY